jgi:hypothetical protein
MRSRFRLTLATIAFVAATGCAAPGTEAPVAAAAPPPEETGDIAALESAFWYCDWVATTEGVLATPMAACQFATSELKARKFGGSSRALAAWWRENKAAEHGRLGRAAQK